MAPFNIFSKDLPRTDISLETYSKPKPLIDFMKDVWKKGIHFADRLINLTHNINPQTDPTPNNLAKKSQPESKEACRKIEKDQTDQKSRHQIQEAIRRQYKPVPCWLDPNPKYDSYMPRSYHCSNVEPQPQNFMEKHVVPKIQMKKTIILASPGTRGYMNLDKFLQRLKEIKAEKKARQQLKISREEFNEAENVSFDQNTKGKSLMQLMNPDFKEDKKLTLGQERKKFRNNFFNKSVDQPEVIVKGQMTQGDSQSGEKSDKKQNGPQVQRERGDNSTVFESSNEDNCQKESEVEISQVPSSSKQGQTTLESKKSQANNVPNDIKKQHNNQIQSVVKNQSENPKVQALPTYHTQNQDKKPIETASPIISQQKTPKVNPFLSALSPSLQQKSQSQFNIQNTMQEMKKKLFGTTVNSTSQETHPVNTLSKGLPYFGTELHNGLSSNPSQSTRSFVNESLKQVQTNVPMMFSNQNFQQVNPFTQPSCFQNLTNVRNNMAQQPQQQNQQNYNYPQLNNSSNPPQLPFINTNYQSFTNQGAKASSFESHKNNFTHPIHQTYQHQHQLPSFLGPSSHNTSFMASHVSTPKNNNFGSHSLTTVYKDQMRNQSVNNPITPSIKPSQLGENRKKIVMNSFMAPSNSNLNKNSGLFTDKEDEWDRRTEKKLRSNTGNRRRQKRQDRIWD